MSRQSTEHPRASALWLTLFVALLFIAPLPAHSQSTEFPRQGNARDNWEINCTIRHEKFDYVLPAAMRANDVDMWIVIDRGRGTEPLALDFGISTVNIEENVMITNRGIEWLVPPQRSVLLIH